MDTLSFKKLPESYWISSTSETKFPSLDKDIEVDLAIVGGGMVGITTAYQLKDQELSIAILEADKICLSTSAHTTAKITSQHGLVYHKLIKDMGEDLARQYAEANEKAIKEIQQIIDNHNIDCDYLPQAAYIYSQEDKYLKDIENEVDAAKSLGIEASLVKKIPLDIDIKAGVKFDNQAQFHPRKFLLPLADLVQKSGLSIYEETRVLAMEEDDDSGHYILSTSQAKKVRAKKVIIASHYPFYNKASMYFARLYVERSYILAVKTREKFPGGIYINAEDPPRSLRSLETEDGQLVLVVGDKHKTGQGEDTQTHYKNLFDFAQELFTIEDIPYRWSTQDCMTLDGIPYIGHFTEDTPNLYIATGFQKWGMTNSIVASILLRDLIVQGQSPWQEVYNPSRKNIIASTKEFISQNINVAGQLLKGKFSKLPDELKLKPGDSKIFEHHGERIGAYRDDQGNLHFVDTTCTHLGCELNWNSAERSWDCPCHGSRFSYEGQVIQGPAVKPLSFDKDVSTLLKVIKEDF